MFDFVRNHTRLVLGFLLLLIIPSFVFFGVQGYSRFTEAGNETVAKVDGVAITRAEWDAAHARNVERMRRQTPDLDVALLDTPQVRRETLDGMVRERVLLAAANELQLFPSVARMAMLFDSDPQFAGLRGPDGSINRDLLAAQGMTPEMFDQRLRQDFAMQQVLAGITQTPVAPAATAAAALDPLLQRREVQLQRFDPAAYRGRVNPDRCRARGLLQGQRGTLPGARAGAASNTWCSTWNRWPRPSPCPRTTCAPTTPRTPAATRWPRSGVPATS